MSGVFLHAFEHGMGEATRIARRLAASVGPISVHSFPDEETLVTVSRPGAHACIYCPLDRPNLRLVELLLAVDALRRNGARRLVLVAPYLCYMRQDKAFHAGEAVSQQAISQLFSGLFDRIVTVDPHLHRVGTLAAVFPGIETECLSAAAAIADFAMAKGMTSDMLVAGPDEESRQWVEQIAAPLGCMSLVGEKRRLGDRRVEIEFPARSLDGKTILLTDDIVSSGGTMIEATRSLKRRGAGAIKIAVSHALFSAETGARLREAGADEIWSTTSVPHPTNCIALDPLLADALRKELE
ncbi:MAG: ribose-phosphate diphosphokinase [Parvibaculum sp.]|uniref:ribose-phosphate diphosphokinase n=1 Tax=Parvibaculum sp. TaxID=2024848 RepID=UPI0025E4D980|nr:ribose-phosphate diphosphokinase [Parvibaculum sp.]MCE9650081.1 ribose-phosphate diphosphokinase [Parvibaculum sp.]